MTAKCGLSADRPEDLQDESESGFIGGFEDALEGDKHPEGKK